MGLVKPTAAGAITSVNGKTGAVTLGASDVGAIATSLEGVANGVATTDSSGNIPASQLGNVPNKGSWTTISTQTLSAAASTLVLSNIPQTYKAIKVIITGKITDNAYMSGTVTATMNSIATGYDSQSMSNIGTTPSGTNNDGGTSWIINNSMASSEASNNYSAMEIDFLNYSDSSNPKLLKTTCSNLNYTNGTQSNINVSAGQNVTTAAISTVTFNALNANNAASQFATGTKITLLGMN